MRFCMNGYCAFPAALCPYAITELRLSWSLVRLNLLFLEPLFSVELLAYTLTPIIFLGLLDCLLV